MNWINSVVRPKIRGLLTTTTKREPPDDFWRQCPSCGQMLDHKALADNLFVFPCCEHHSRIGAQTRLEMLFDGGHYVKIGNPEVPLDPLKFKDVKRYTDRLKAAKTATELDNAVLVGEGKLNGMPITAAAQDFRFMGGSLGMGAGEAVVAGMFHAVEKKTPFILFAASGGARMQEGILSLMQMPRTTIGIQALRDAGLPYIVVLTDPTTGGVTASYAMLGDIHIAEPGALICFAGPRVIEQTIREQLPDGFQRAEYLLAHGMIDMVVKRKEMKETLSRLCDMLMHGARPAQNIAESAETAVVADTLDDDSLADKHKGVNGHSNGSPATTLMAGELASDGIDIVIKDDSAAEKAKNSKAVDGGKENDLKAAAGVVKDAESKSKSKGKEGKANGETGAKER